MPQFTANAAPGAAFDAAPTPRRAGPVLVATDGSALGTNAAVVAAALAARDGREVRVLHVVDTRAIPIPAPVGFGIALADAVLGPEAHADQERELRAGIGRALGRGVDWPVRVALGTPATAIVAEAARVGAALVVVGLQYHGRLARLAQDETAVHAARAAGCPVLAATAGLRAAPRRAVAAVDFSRASVGAARAALELLGGEGTLVLAYAPPLPMYDAEDGEHLVHELGVDAAFAWVERELAAPPAVRVERAVLRGRQPCPVGMLLLDHAAATGADLIAVGSRRHGRVERLVLGSVTTDALRDGRVSVLVIPPAAERAEPNAPGAAAGTA
jgi:nucleotide-binding universal stress UspA family protein